MAGVAGVRSRVGSRGGARQRHASAPPSSVARSARATRRPRNTANRARRSSSQRSRPEGLDSRQELEIGQRREVIRMEAAGEQQRADQPGPTGVGW